MTGKPDTDQPDAATVHAMKPLVRKGASPLYEQVRERIVGRIRDGIWPPDTRIPSENELVRQLKVSRITVNRALRELTEAGELVRIQGVGTYVAHPKPMTALFEMTPIDEEIRAKGRRYSGHVHLLRKENSFPELAAAMETEMDAPVFHAVVVHHSDGQPVMLEDLFVHPLSAPEFPDQDFTRISPMRYLMNMVPIQDVEHIIEALPPDGPARELLGMADHEPCLVLHRQTWDHYRVATHSRMTYPGSGYRIGARLKPLFKRYVEQTRKGDHHADQQ